MGAEIKAIPHLVRSVVIWKTVCDIEIF